MLFGWLTWHWRNSISHTTRRDLSLYATSPQILARTKASEGNSSAVPLAQGACVMQPWGAEPWASAPQGHPRGAPTFAAEPQGGSVTVRCIPRCPSDHVRLTGPRRGPKSWVGRCAGRPKGALSRFAGSAPLGCMTETSLGFLEDKGGHHTFFSTWANE